MSSSEHEASDTLLQPARARSARRQRLGKWLPVAVAATIMAALAAVLLARASVFTTRPSAGSGGASISWQTYHDSFGLFTLQVPSDWMARTEPATTWYGTPTASTPVSFDMVTFNDPAQGAGSAHVWITAYPIKTAAARQYYCLQPSDLQRFAPRTLSSMEPGGAWLFTTENASVQIDVGIPGVVMPARFGSPRPTGTPLPAPWLATDKREVNTMLVSFQPTDTKPLAC
jgi:hypothetical protein